MKTLDIIKHADSKMENTILYEQLTFHNTESQKVYNMA